MTMFTHSQAMLFEDELMSSAQDFPANPLVKQASNSDETMSDISFPKSLRLWHQYGQPGVCLRMFADSLVSSLDKYSPRLSHRWKGKVTKSLRFVFQLQPSMPRIGETGFGLLLTPRTNEHVEDRERFVERNGDRTGDCFPNLATQVAMLRTPIANDAVDRKCYVNSRGEPMLSGQIALTIPTPRAFMHKDAASDRGKSNLGEVIGLDNGLKLQPNFVEWMMSFPIGWTDLNHSETP